MFGLGFPEIIFILLVAVLILGPEHTPRAARFIGKWSSKLRSAATSFNDAVTQDVDLREIKESLGTMKSEIDLARDEIRLAAKPVDSVSDEAHQAIESARAELRDFQAQTGRSAPSTGASDSEPSKSTSDSENPPGDEKIHPEPAPFMSRPLGAGCAADSLENAPLPEHGHRVIRLAKPAFLPEKLSLLVSRRRVNLPMPSGTENHRRVPLEHVRPNAAFCKVCRLPLPACEDLHSQKRVHFDKVN